MKKLAPGIQSILFFFALLTVVSCDNRKTTPFPKNPSGYKTPVAVPFEFPESGPLQLSELSSDSIPKAVTLPLDFSKLPSVPFSINDFRPLKSPLASVPLRWGSLDQVKINLDSIKGRQVAVRKFILPEPVITRHSPATKLEGTTSGILSLGQAEGLPGTLIYAMVGDALGTVWISTERGITRYNGDVFETYNFFEKADDGGLEPISDLEIDSDGNLLVLGRVSGLYRVNVTSKIVEQFQIGSFFWRIKEDHTGRIWLTHNEGLSFIDKDSHVLKPVGLPVSYIDNAACFALMEDKSNNLWIGYSNKIAIVNEDRNSLRVIGEREGLSIGTPYEFTSDQRGKVWISAFSRTTQSISLAEDKIFTLGPSQGFFGVARAIAVDPFERIWIVDNDTVVAFDEKTNMLKKVPTGTAIRTTGHPAGTITDVKGNIWIGTLRAKILIVDPNGMLAEHFNTSNGLVSNEVWGIQEDKKKRIWLATYQGINIYDPAKGRLYLLKLPDKISANDHRGVSRLDEDHLFVGSVRGFWIVNLTSNTISVYKQTSKINGVYWRAIKDRQGDIWITASNGVFKFNREQNKVWKVDESSSIGIGGSWISLEDEFGKIWLGSRTGVNVIDPKKNTILALDRKHGLGTDYTSMIILTSKGEIVVGGDRGLSIFDRDQKHVTKLGAGEGLLPEGMFDMNEQNGRIHVGSENGLIVIDRPDAAVPGSFWRFTNYGKWNGFPYTDFNQSTSMRASDGKLWWGAAPVLTVALQDPMIDSIPPVAHITDFNIMDQNSSFVNTNLMNASLLKGDTLWNSERTSYYLKDAFPADSTYLAISGIEWDSLSAAYQMPIGLKLPYDQNSFHFTFNNLDVEGRDKIVYRYILEGEEDRWSEVSSKSGSKNFYNIDPGDYTFKVATRGFNGVWSQPAEISFTILPPWWNTWWAYILYVIGFSGAVWLTAQFRSRWLEKENKVLEDKVSHRTAQLKKTIEELKETQTQLIQSEKMASLGELTAGIAHEIQNPLNFVNNFSEVNSELIVEMKEELAKGNVAEASILANDIDENEKKIVFHGKRADGIVKGMLQHSRSSNGLKEPTEINALADEYLRLAYHGLRAKDKSFNANMKTDFDENVGKVSVVSQDMGRVILNLITNAFYTVAEKKKQTTGAFEPTVSVTTKRQGDRVIISVNDNGNGIPEKIRDRIFQPFFTTKPTGQGTGLGLSLSYDIIKAHGGELKVESREGEGTTFIISLPNI